MVRCFFLEFIMDEPNSQDKTMRLEDDINEVDAEALARGKKRKVTTHSPLQGRGPFRPNVKGLPLSGPYEKVERKRQLTLNVWDECERVKLPDGSVYAICRHCKKRLTGSSTNDTSHLRNHLMRCIMRGQTTIDHNQTELNMVKTEHGVGKLETWIYDQDKAREALRKAIIVHEYPLAMVEHEEFRNFMQVVQPKFKSVSRNTMRADIIKFYKMERERFKNSLQENKGRIAITTDMWTAGSQKRGYMAVTAHYIDNNWELQSRLLRFMFVPTPHTAAVICDALYECLALTWDVDHKLSSLTVDNCTTNDAMIDLILSKLHKPALLLEGSLFHMRCSAHVLNLIVKDGLDIIGPGIERVRDSVVYWSATPKRWKKFEKTCKKFNIGEPKKLVLDCRTRWNSTYLMLLSALPYKDVFSSLGTHHVGYDFAPTHADWTVAAEICEKLQIFFKVTELFSGSKYPTASLFFPKICDVRTELSNWMICCNEPIRSMAGRTMAKFEKYWATTNLALAIATVLDPRYKLRLVEFFFRRIYGDISYKAEVDKVRGLLFDLVDEYQRKNPNLRKQASTSNSIIQECEISVDTQKDGMDYFLMHISNEGSQNTPRSDLEFYLDDGLVPTNKSETFDILAWWKTNGLKFPILYEIALDVLAIPITSVASESAFSTGGRVIEPYRSRLRPNIVEALMCCQSWIRGGNQANIPTFIKDYEDGDDVDEDDSVPSLQIA